MAYTTTTTLPSLFTRLSAAVGDLHSRYKTYRLYRETLEGLSALSTRDLADLGLSRADLHRVAREAAYK